MKNEYTLRAADAGVVKNIITASNILYVEGQSDMHNGQISARILEEQEFWIKGATIGFEEVNDENIIRMSVDGDVVLGKVGVPPEWNLHSEIYKARPDVKSIIHTHPANAIAFSATGMKLVPISHEACPFYDRLNVFDFTTNTILDASMAAKVADALGSNNAVILRNHGIVTVGKSIKHATIYALLLERACALQLKVNGFDKLLYSNDVDVYAKNEYIFGDAAITSYFNYYARKVQREYQV